MKCMKAGCSAVILITDIEWPVEQGAPGRKIQVTHAFPVARCHACLTIHEVVIVPDAYHTAHTNRIITE